MKAHPNADPSGLHADADGNNWRLIEWGPGEPRQEVWDMGQLPDREYAKLRDRYLSGEITLEEFRSRYQNPANYSVQDPSRNRSHVDEK